MAEVSGAGGKMLLKIEQDQQYTFGLSLSKPSAPFDTLRANGWMTQSVIYLKLTVTGFAPGKPA